MKNKLPIVFWSFLFLIASQSNIYSQSAKFDSHDWWSVNHLNLSMSQKEPMPDASTNQAKHFLSFKKNWVIEAEGLINHHLKQNSLQIESLTVGENNFNGKHVLTINVAFKQVQDSDRHNQANIMAFVYTTDSPAKDLSKVCKEKLNKELIAFKKDWKVLGNLKGEIENDQHRIEWAGVIGVK